MAVATFKTVRLMLAVGLCDRSSCGPLPEELLEDIEQTIFRYVRLYNGQLPQSVLNARTPIDALKDWQKLRPDLFRKRPYNHAGCDT